MNEKISTGWVVFLMIVAALCGRACIQPTQCEREHPQSVYVCNGGY